MPVGGQASRFTEKRETPKPLAQSAALPSDKREQLISQVKNVDLMVGMFDDAASANNADSAHGYHKAIDEALNNIHGMYPAGVMPMHMDNKNHGMGMPKDGQMPGMGMPMNGKMN